MPWWYSTSYRMAWHLREGDLVILSWPRAGMAVEQDLSPCCSVAVCTPGKGSVRVTSTHMLYFVLVFCFCDPG